MKNTPESNVLMTMAANLSVGGLLFFCAAEVAFSQSPALSWHDVQEAGSEHLMTVTAPPGYQPEDVLRTILENPKLPPHIRQPFVELARIKAPYLLED